MDEPSNATREGLSRPQGGVGLTGDGGPRNQSAKAGFSRHVAPRKLFFKSLKAKNGHARFSTHETRCSEGFFAPLLSRFSGRTLISILAPAPAISLGILVLAGLSAAHPQNTSLQVDNPESASQPVLAHRPANDPPPVETVTLTVPKGTPVQVALDKEVRIKKTGQSLHGRVVEPVYAFDRVVIPVGTEVTGRIKRIEPVSAFVRTTSALDADFTPTRKIDVEFTELALPNGKHLPISANVIPGSGQVIQFVSAEEANKKKTLKGEAEAKTSEAKQQARQQWDNAIKQVEAPGKVHRIKRYAISLLPVHPQYLDSGMAYFAELQEPLDFGTEPLTPDLVSSVGTTPPEGSMVHARLVTPLSSGTAQKGDEVEAIVSQPLFDGSKLIIPQGSFLKGDVVQVMSARRLNRNGQLRFVFHELMLPDGVEQKIDAVLSGVEAGKAQNLKLDSEGGAQATSPKSRYLQTGVAVGMAMLSAGGDADSKVANPAGNTSNRVIGGAGGFKLVGMALGAAVQSRAFGYSMGAYGAGMSVYTHFISRGREVVFPKDTAMDIGVATRPKAP